MALNPNWPVMSHLGAFNVSPNSGTTPVWSDLTARVTAFDCGYGIDYDLAVPQSGTADYTLRDNDDALNPLNASSPFNTSGNTLQPQRQVRSAAWWPVLGNVLNDGNSTQPDAAVGATDSNMETSIGHWAATGGSVTTQVLSQSATQAWQGTKSLRIAFTTAVASGFGIQQGAGLLVPVVPNQTYTFSGYVYIPSVSGAPGIGLIGSGSFGTSTAVTNTWTRLTMNFTTSSTQTTAFLIFASTANTTSGQLAYIDGVQLEFGSSVSTYSATGPIYYPLSNSLIERLPKSWSMHGQYGWSTMTCSDAMSLLPSFTMPDCATADVMQDNPQTFYPLTNAAGTLVAPDASGVTNPPLSMSQVGIGGIVAYGATAAPSVDGLTCATFTPVNSTNGVYLQSAGRGIGTGAFGGFVGLSLEVWFNTTTVSTGLFGAYNFGSGIQATLDGSGHIVVQHTTTRGVSYDYTITSANTYTDGNWHHVVVTESLVSTTVTATLWVDGVSVGTATRTDTAVMGVFLVQLGLVSWLTPGSLFIGSMSRFAGYSTALSSARIASHYASGTSGFANDTTGTRAARIISWSGWKGNATHTNLIPNSSFEAGITGWVPNTNSTVTWGSTNPVVGSHCLRVTAIAAGATVAQGALFAATANTSYSISIYAKSAGANNVDTDMYIYWTDATGAGISTTSVPTLTLNPGPYRIGGVGTSPAGAAYGIPVILFTAVAAGDPVDFDCAMVEQASTLNAWYDGSYMVGIDAGSSSMGSAAGIAGKSAFDLLQAVATTEGGYFFADPTGALNFQGRDSRSLKTAATFTLGESGTAYEGDITQDFDDQYIYNQVIVTMLNGQTVTASDATSQAAYTIRTLAVSIASNSLTDATGLAQHYLNRYKNPLPRIAGIKLRPSATLQWATALGIKFGDRVTATRTTATGTYSHDYFIIGRHHAAVPDSWETDLIATSVDPFQPWILGDATYGVLGSTTIPTY